MPRLGPGLLFDCLWLPGIKRQTSFHGTLKTAAFELLITSSITLFMTLKTAASESLIIDTENSTVVLFLLDPTP